MSWPSHRRTARRTLRLEPLEERDLLTAYGADASNTASYMLGDVVVTVVALESNGQVDASTEDWRPDTISAMKARIEEGVTWWEDTLRNLPTWWYPGASNPPEIRHQLNFTFDYTYTDTPFETRYEPIARTSEEHTLFVREFLESVGTWDVFKGYEGSIRDFNDQQRQAYEADWAFTIFVANDENDVDGKWKVGGSFLQAFSFPGGQYIVTPAGRPPSTLAHEVGHQFWARDEYEPAGSYLDHRGYLDAFNTNAWDNPNLSQREPSIMDRGTLLQDAYGSNRSSVSSLEMIGWRDSDADGVFDILDVPLSLEGYGFYDADAGLYRFQGKAQSNALPNLNPSEVRNDITLNELSRVEYRLDGGPWQTASSPGGGRADIDIAFPVASDVQSVEIRAVSVEVDPFGNEWQITESPYLVGGLDEPATVGNPGIRGFVWYDIDGDQAWGRSEIALQRWDVALKDAQGNPLGFPTTVEPDDFAEGQVIDSSTPGLTLSAVVNRIEGKAVRVQSESSATTGSRVFAYERSPGFWSADWTQAGGRLRVDFDQAAGIVAIDVIASTGAAQGRIDAYDAQGNLVARATSSVLSQGRAERLVVRREAYDIARVEISAHGANPVQLDRLTVGPETATQTDANGAYAFELIPAGTYTVEVAAPTDWLITEPTSGSQTATVALGQSTADIDFGAKRDGDHRLWQNPNEPSDVNGRDGVTPLDVLLVVIDLNTNGARSLLPVNGAPLPPPFVDVNGDDVVSPKDILEVVSTLTALTSSSGQGEGEGVVWVERPRSAPALPSAPEGIAVSETDVEWREGLRTGGVAASDSSRASGAPPAEAREMLMGFDPSRFDVEDPAWGPLWEDVTLGWSDGASDEEAG